MFKGKYRFFCDKLSSLRAFGVSVNCDDGIYVGIYFYKYFLGIQKAYIRKQKTVKRKVI